MGPVAQTTLRQHGEDERQAHLYINPFCRARLRRLMREVGCGCFLGTHLGLSVCTPLWKHPSRCPQDAGRPPATHGTPVLVRAARQALSWGRGTGVRRPQLLLHRAHLSSGTEAATVGKLGGGEQGGRQARGRGRWRSVRGPGGGQPSCLGPRQSPVLLPGPGGPGHVFCPWSPGKAPVSLEWGVFHITRLTRFQASCTQRALSSGYSAALVRNHGYQRGR